MTDSQERRNRFKEAELERQRLEAKQREAEIALQRREKEREEELWRKQNQARLDFVRSIDDDVTQILMEYAEAYPIFSGSNVEKSQGRSEYLFFTWSVSGDDTIRHSCVSIHLDFSKRFLFGERASFSTHGTDRNIDDIDPNMGSLVQALSGARPTVHDSSSRYC